MRGVLILIMIAFSMAMAQRDSYSAIASLREDARVKFTHKVQRTTGPTCQAAIDNAVPGVRAGGGYITMATCYLIDNRNYEPFMTRLLSDLRGKGWTLIDQKLNVPTGYGFEVNNWVYMGSKGILGVTASPFTDGKFLMFVILAVK